MVRFGARAAGLTAEFEERLQALPRQRSLSKTATWREQLSKTSPTTICLTVVALLTAAYLLLIRPIQLRSLDWSDDGAPVPPDDLPADFSWQAYLKWNPELQADGVTNRDAAERHYVDSGRAQQLVYRDFELTIRYTACGGLMNQHYCHLSALVLAHLAHARAVVWPPMQERTSFNRRYHTNAAKNEQSWLYLDATSLWDLPRIQQRIKEQYDIDVIKHPPDAPIPDMTKLETAFQSYALPAEQHESQLRFKKPIYIARHNPYMLARAVMDAGRQVLLKHGHQPSTVLVDLPCTLFMMDNRNLTVVEDIAKLLDFSPQMTALADKVIAGIMAPPSGGAAIPGVPPAGDGAPGGSAVAAVASMPPGSVAAFNGVHLRMEKDAADWAIIMGGRQRLWTLYKEAMARAGLDPETPLYIASGLLKAAAEDQWSRDEMRTLTGDIVASKLASHIVYKEMFLTEGDLAGVRNEQSGLIDFLVMRKAAKLVGIGVSTFSFYLAELRLMDGVPPVDTELLMASYIGTDELFFSCGIAAVGTRMALEAEGRLPNLCRRPSGRQCFIDAPQKGA